MSDDAAFAALGVDRASGRIAAVDGSGHVWTDADKTPSAYAVGVLPVQDAVLIGSSLIAAGAGVEAIDLATGEVRARRDDLDQAVVIADGFTQPPLLAVGTSSGSVLVLDATDLSTVAGPFVVGDTAITDMAWSHDGKRLAVGTTGETSTDVKVIDLADGVQRSLRGHTGEVSAVAFSPNDSLLASGSDDRSVITWSTTDWRNVGTFVGHEDRVRRLDFTTDGATLVTVSDDSTIRLWNVRQRTPVGLPIRWDSSPVRDLQVSGDRAVSLHSSAVATWIIGTDEWLRRACQVTARQLTTAEQSTYFGDRATASPCEPSA